MATGTPFIARPTGCIAHMAGGVLASRIADAAAAIDRLLGDPKAWSSLNEAGRQSVAADHKLQTNVDRLLCVLTAGKGGVS